MNYYIYKIENLVNHKKYIGLTNNIARRRTRHFSDLKRNVHDNHFLQKEYNIYGKDNFSFTVLFNQDCTDLEISKKEQEYIKLYDSYYNGYNQNEGGNFGPNNGGTKLTKTDIFNILAVLEFLPRSGQTLANIYDVSRTTISRIRKGINHCQYKEEYDKLPIEDRKEYYNIFQESYNIVEQTFKNNSMKTKRLLTKEQVFLILYNFENKIIPITTLTKIIGVKSDNTLYSIQKGESYKDYFLEYNNLDIQEKNKLATLLSN